MNRPVKKGQKYDLFGEVWEVVRVFERGRKVTVRRTDYDAFGRPIYTTREWHTGCYMGRLVGVSK